MLVNDNVKGTSFTDNIDISRLQTYYYSIVAQNEGMCSEETLTPKVNCGEYIIPPYSESFKTKDAFELYKVINSNGDDREWTWSNGVAQYQYSMKNSADDWLLTPPIKLTKGSKYVFSY